MSGTMGKAPMNPGQVTPNLHNPSMSGMFGAMQGFGMGGKMQNYYQNQNQGGNTNYGVSNNAAGYNNTGGTGGQYTNYNNGY